MLADLARGFRQLVYPAVCVRCEVLVGRAGEDFCPDCVATLTSDPHFTCPRCAATVGEHTDVSEGCPGCRHAGFSFNSAGRLGVYDGPLRDAVLAMKRSAGQQLAGSVGRLWARHHADRFRSLGINVVIPVPLHWWPRFRWSRSRSRTRRRRAPRYRRPSAKREEPPAPGQPSAPPRTNQVAAVGPAWNA